MPGWRTRPGAHAVTLGGGAAGLKSPTCPVTLLTAGFPTEIVAAFIPPLVSSAVTMALVEPTAVLPNITVAGEAVGVDTAFGIDGGGGGAKKIAAATSLRCCPPTGHSAE